MKNWLLVALFSVTAPAGAVTDTVISFDFTGRLIVGVPPSLSPPSGFVHANLPISAQLQYQVDAGIGSSGLSITADVPLLGQPLNFHDISMTHQAGTNLIDGTVLVDFATQTNMPVHVEWDATGLLNAIDFGLQPGDILSGTNLYRDTNGDGVGQTGEWLANIQSAIPFSDSLLIDPSLTQGPAPLAATGNSLGAGPGTAFEGIRGYFDIGSGNSMHVTAISSVPVPVAGWLFGSALLGLLGVVRRKR